ncbi:MAG TPA: tetratricopeptide repeat protein [Candidatus Sulfotelmatobacter sp.]|nr:tetratricopeptide repeat protein [Candidatus Sulfotelmatobacter sp.]
MKQTIRTVLSVAVSFVFVILLVQNYRHQRDTDRRLAEIQRELRGGSAVTKPAAQPSPPVVIMDEGSIGSEAAQKQRNLQQILTIGWQFVNSRKPSEAAKAVTIFNEGISNVDPNSPELYNGLGRALLIAGRPREAFVAWRKGLALAPQFSDMQSGIGWAYWWLNDPCRAKQAWQRALSTNPHSVDAWSAMAWIDLASQRYDEAKRGFQELVQSDPTQKSWAMGLSLARANNGDQKQIAQFFPLPPLERFTQPLPIDPTSEQSRAVRNAAYYAVSSEKSKQ